MKITITVSYKNKDNLDVETFEVFSKLAGAIEWLGNAVSDIEFIEDEEPDAFIEKTEEAATRDDPIKVED